MSMSTSLLHHAWGLAGYRHQFTQFLDGRVFFWITQRRERLRCLACGTEHVFAQGATPRFFRSLPIGGKPVVVCLPVPGVRCLHCDHLRQVNIPFTDPRRS
jgi:transposase